jgi:hypothetical protein
MADTNLDSILQKLRQLFEDEYERGHLEALRRVVDVIKQPGGRGGARTGRRGRKAGGRMRARRGSARAFIERVLRQKRTASVPEIMSSASTPDEKAVSISAIRFELYRGKKEKRYRNTKGRWSLPAARGAKA